MRVPVETIVLGQTIQLPNGQQRQVVTVDKYPTVGMETVDGYVIVYDTGERTRATEVFESEPIHAQLATARAGDCYEVVAGG